MKKKQSAADLFDLKGRKRKSLQPVENKGYFITIEGEQHWVNVYPDQEAPSQKMKKKSKTRVTSDFDLTGAWRKD